MIHRSITKTLQSPLARGLLEKSSLKQVKEHEPTKQQNAVR